MTDQPSSSRHRSIAASLGRTRLVTRVVMVVERGWPLVLPLLVLASLFFSLSWLGLFRIIPDIARMILLAAFAFAGIAALYPLRLFRLPTRDEIDRRIESANALEHTPVLAQSDRPSGKNDDFSQALWREHQKRMADKLGALGSDLPRTRVPERDPWALRAAAALLLVTAFTFSFGPIGGRLSDGFRAHATRDVVAPRIDAWVTPPAYTGKPPIFLVANANQEAAVITVPQDSDLSLRVTGGSGEETLAFADASGMAHDIALAGPATDANKPAQVATTTVRQFSGKLASDGTLTLKSGDDPLGSWAFVVTPDTPPVIRFAGDPKRAANGTLELTYAIEDDYGAASAKAGFALADTPSPDARPLYGPPDMPLSLPRRGATANKPIKASRDLTEHVWAGANVALTLHAVDDAGQQATSETSETRTITLPERPFTNPLARAVLEQRRLLALDANAKPQVLELMDAITLRPEDTFDNAAHFLALMSARTRLKMARTDDQLREVVTYLWQIALGIEDGDLSNAEKRLRQAQQALQEALQNGASDEQIDKLMAELRKAMDDFLREFAERAQKNPNMAPSQQAQELRQGDLQRMLDQIENLAKSGNRDQARELLSQLQDMMNNLQAGKPRPGQQGQENSEMRQQMDKLGEIMRRQQETMNETFRTDQMRPGQQRNDEGLQGEGRPDQQRRPGNQAQQGEPMTPEQFAEALKQLQEGQGQLEKDLEALMKGLEGLGIKPGEGFGEAGDAMNQAEGSLGRGEGDRAVGQQGRALEALRKGAQDMMQQLQAMQGDQGSGEQGSRQQNADRDPLGRPRATTGSDSGDSVKVPDEIDTQRARQILEAIRKRLGNALSPELERSYLERLLKLN